MFEWICQWADQFPLHKDTDDLRTRCLGFMYNSYHTSGCIIASFAHTFLLKNPCFCFECTAPIHVFLHAPFTHTKQVFQCVFTVTCRMIMGLKFSIKTVSSNSSCCSSCFLLIAMHVWPPALGHPDTWSPKLCTAAPSVTKIAKSMDCVTCPSRALRHFLLTDSDWPAC